MRGIAFRTPGATHKDPSPSNLGEGSSFVRRDSLSLRSVFPRGRSPFRNETQVLRSILSEPERNASDQREVDGVRRDSLSLRSVSSEGALPPKKRECFVSDSLWLKESETKH